MKLNLEQEFNNFLKIEGIKNLPAEKYRQMKRSFYYGAGVMLQYIKKHGNDVDVQESIEETYIDLVKYTHNSKEKLK